MAITHMITSIRQRYTEWLVDCVVNDSEPGVDYNFRWTFDHEVTAESSEVVNKADIAKTDIQLETQMQENDLNLTSDEERAVEHLRNVKAGIVGQIRSVPGATLAQASAWVAENYPDSIIDFPQLYQWYLTFLGLSTWDEFKTFCINHKFRGIDDVSP